MICSKLWQHKEEDEKEEEKNVRVYKTNNFIILKIKN
jgi:hypothetical protein